MTPRVVIVGGGPAGIRAAEKLVAAGLRPMLIDEAPRSGGQIYRRPPEGFSRPPSKLYGTEAPRAVALHATADALLTHIDYRPDTLVWSIWGQELHLLSGGREEVVPFDALILATGATDRVIPIPGWQQAGVYSLGAMQIALKAQGIALGHKVAFVGTGPLLYLVAAQYAEAGANVAGVFDTASRRDLIAALPAMARRPGLLIKGMALERTLRRHRIPVHRGVRPVAIHADRPGTITGLEIETRHQRQTIACDAVGLGFHLRPETQLADLAGCQIRFAALTHQWVVDADHFGRTSVDGVYVAGDGARIAGADAAEVAGRLAARAVLTDLGLPVQDGAADLRSRARLARFAKGLARAFPWPHSLAATLPDDTVLCRCENVTVGEVRHAATTLGAAEINRAKAFSRVGMGRCQGRYCGPAAAEIIAQAAGSDIANVGRIRGQAPIKPLPMAVETSA